MYLFKVWLHSSQLALRIGDVWLLLAVVATACMYVWYVVITTLKVPQDYLEIPTVLQYHIEHQETQPPTNKRTHELRSFVESF